VQGVISWTYQIQRNGQPVAELEFRFPSRQCEIRFEGESFHVVTDPNKSELELLAGEEWLGTARDVSVARPHYELRTEHHALELTQSSLLSSKYELSENGRGVGAIAQVHPATANASVEIQGEMHPGSADASVEIQDEVPVLLQIFAFALVALAWHGVKPALRST
jgi:hypothetical protein